MWIKAGCSPFINNFIHVPDMPESNAWLKQWAILQERVGHRFTQLEQLAAALTHRSYAEETGVPAPTESQRLEFLGDAVLGAVVAEWLVTTFPQWQEGTLTKVRSRLTNGAVLARVARQIELGAGLRLGRGAEQSGGRDQDSILADTLEAVVGAVWLDGGIAAVRQLFHRCFTDEIEAAISAGGDDNPKGELQELLQRHGRTAPHYEVIEETGPPHARLFRMAVLCQSEKLGEGSGSSKREAEINAARKALVHWARVNGITPRQEE